MDWFGIRSLYLFGVNKNGLNVFEERVVVFMAANFDEAFRKGKRESEIYAKDNGFKLYDEQVAYKQDGSSLIDGYEVWSELFEANLSLDEFYKERYRNYEYHPENTQ